MSISQDPSLVAPAGRAALPQQDLSPAAPHTPKRSVRVAELDRVIELLKRRLTRCVHERKSILTAERMREKMRDPAYARRFREGRKASVAGSAEHWAWRQKISRMTRRLPDMSAEQQRVYNKLRYYHDYTREDAIKEAMRPLPVAAE